VDFDFYQAILMLNGSSCLRVIETLFHSPDKLRPAHGHIVRLITKFLLSSP
jgi:hypothetical protein